MLIRLYDTGAKNYVPTRGVHFRQRTPLNACHQWSENKQGNYTGGKETRGKDKAHSHKCDKMKKALKDSKRISRIDEDEKHLNHRNFYPHYREITSQHKWLYSFKKLVWSLIFSA